MYSDRDAFLVVSLNMAAMMDRNLHERWWVNASQTLQRHFLRCGEWSNAHFAFSAREGKLRETRD